MECKCDRCNQELEITCDSLYSSEACYNCGNYYYENGTEEILIKGYCLAIVNNSYFYHITSRSELLTLLRKLKNASCLVRMFFDKLYITKEKLFIT